MINRTDHIATLMGFTFNMLCVKGGGGGGIEMNN